MPPGTTLAQTTASPQRVIPLLQAVSRLEENVAALAMRLDPITSHLAATADSASPPQSSVTGRLQQLGDALQYLLDNIEL